MRRRVFSDAQLEGKTWQQLARMAHDRHVSQTEKSWWSIVDLMLETVGPAHRAGFEGTMKSWFDTIMKPASRRVGQSANPPIVEPADSPTDQSLDEWLEEL